MFRRNSIIQKDEREGRNGKLAEATEIIIEVTQETKKEDKEVITKDKKAMGELKVRGD